MQIEDAAQYRPRFQSPTAKHAIADPTLQMKRMAGKIKRFWTCIVENARASWERGHLRHPRALPAIRSAARGYTVEYESTPTARKQQNKFRRPLRQPIGAPKVGTASPGTTIALDIAHALPVLARTHILDVVLENRRSTRATLVVVARISGAGCGLRHQGGQP